MRSKLLGFPTSMALAIVGTDGRGSKRPVNRYSGTTSLTLVAATKCAMGRPARLAIKPAVRLPKFPLGVQTMTSAALEARPPLDGFGRGRPEWAPICATA